MRHAIIGGTCFGEFGDMALMLTSNAIVALNNGDVELRPMLQVHEYEFGHYLEGVSL
jgi:hypothetical protein